MKIFVVKKCLRKFTNSSGILKISVFTYFVSSFSAFDLLVLVVTDVKVDRDGR